MNIFILEDSPERIKRFRDWLFKHDLFITDKALEAIDMLTNNKYDTIFLDHDLGHDGKRYDSSDSNTGYQVAKIIGNTINKDTQTIVHSMNTDGAKNMMAVLGDHAVYKPFWSIKPTDFE